MAYISIHLNGDTHKEYLPLTKSGSILLSDSGHYVTYDHITGEISFYCIEGKESDIIEAHCYDNEESLCNIFCLRDGLEYSTTERARDRYAGVNPNSLPTDGYLLGYMDEQARTESIRLAVKAFPRKHKNIGPFKNLSDRSKHARLLKKERHELYALVLEDFKLRNIVDAVANGKRGKISKTEANRLLKKVSKLEEELSSYQDKVGGKWERGRDDLAGLRLKTGVDKKKKIEKKEQVNGYLDAWEWSIVCGRGLSGLKPILKNCAADGIGKKEFDEYLARAGGSALQVVEKTEHRMIKQKLMSKITDKIHGRKVVFSKNLTHNPLEFDYAYMLFDGKFQKETLSLSRDNTVFCSESGYYMKYDDSTGEISIYWPEGRRGEVPFIVFRGAHDNAYSEAMRLDDGLVELCMTDGDVMLRSGHKVNPNCTVPSPDGSFYPLYCLAYTASPDVFPYDTDEPVGTKGRKLFNSVKDFMVRFKSLVTSDEAPSQSKVQELRDRATQLIDELEVRYAIKGSSFAEKKEQFERLGANSDPSYKGVEMAEKRMEAAACNRLWTLGNIQLLKDFLRLTKEGAPLQEISKTNYEALRAQAMNPHGWQTVSKAEREELVLSCWTRMSEQAMHGQDVSHNASSVVSDAASAEAQQFSPER